MLLKLNAGPNQRTEVSDRFKLPYLCLRRNYFKLFAFRFSI